MYFESLAAAWHMDGHGVYVWLAYALTAIPLRHGLAARQAYAPTLALDSGRLGVRQLLPQQKLGFESLCIRSESNV